MRWERGNERTRHHDLRRTNYDSGTGHHHDDYDHDDDPVTTDCHHIGRTLNLGAFSRLRTGVATSGTVLG